MQAREALRREARDSSAALPAVVKYYGKWPFTRVLGMQVTPVQRGIPCSYARMHSGLLD
jgi:Per1-like family